MKKLISLILVLVFCLSLACTAYAAEDDFVSSPSAPAECEHENTSLVGEKDATCTADGYTGDVVCDHCGKVVEEGAVIGRYGHHFVNGICSVCGFDENNAQTGDNSGIFLWIALMVVAVVCLVAVAVTYRKKFANQ